jgi:hypothetical protein
MMKKLQPGSIRRLELKPISEQKPENIFITQPYCLCSVAAFAGVV